MGDFKKYVSIPKIIIFGNNVGPPEDFGQKPPRVHISGIPGVFLIYN